MYSSLGATILLLVVYLDLGFQVEYLKLVKPEIGRDGENHILTVSIQVRDYNRVMDTKADEVLLGLRDEVRPPLNKVVCNFLGDILQVDPKLIEVVEGHSENEGKKIQIDGSVITVEQIQDRILTALKESIEEERYLKPSLKHREIY